VGRLHRIGEKVVQHNPRKYGQQQIGLERMMNGFLDIMSIMFVGKFGKRPCIFSERSVCCSF
jgi:hypothetical protein